MGVCECFAEPQPLRLAAMLLLLLLRPYCCQSIVTTAISHSRICYDYRPTGGGGGCCYMPILRPLYSNPPPLSYALTSPHTLPPPLPFPSRPLSPQADLLPGYACATHIITYMSRCANHPVVCR